MVMSKMLEVRETLLLKEKDILKEITSDITRRDQNRREISRLKSIRDQVIKIMDKLTDKMTSTIKPDMLRLKLKIEDEILRGRTGDSDSDMKEECEECEVLVFVLNQLKTLLLICDSPAPITDIDIPEAGSQVVFRPRKIDCGPESLETARRHFSDIIDMLDNKITTAYLNIFLNQKDQMESLDVYKDLKVEVEDLFTRSMMGSFAELETEVRRVSHNVEPLLSSCRAACHLSSKCDDCVDTLLASNIEKFQSFINRLQNTDDDLSKTDVRSKLITMIDENNRMERNIVVWKAMNQTLEECDLQRLETYRSIKEPLWMLVNISLQYEGSAELEASLVTMMELLKEKRQVHCQQTISCESQERENLQQVLEKLDHLIESAFFKSKSDPDMLQKNLTIGMIDILNMLEIRVQNIFEEKLRCREEIEMIKTRYM